MEIIAVINTFLLCIIKINSAYHHAAKHAQACHTHTSGIYKSDMSLILLYHTFLMVVLLVVLRPYGSALIPSQKVNAQLGKMARILPRRPNLAQDVAQDPGKSLAAIILAPCTRSWARGGKSWASSCLAQELFANVILRTGLILN